MPHGEDMLSKHGDFCAGTATRPKRQPKKTPAASDCCHPFRHWVTRGVTLSGLSLDDHNEGHTHNCGPTERID